MTDCIVEIKEPLIGNFGILKPTRIFADKPIHKIYIACDPRKTDGYMYSEDDEGERTKLFLFEEPFYVGQAQKFNVRKTSHMRDAKHYYNINFLKEELIRELLDEGLEPIWIIIKENLYQEEANQWEKYYIKLIGRMDLGLGSLLNLNDGGDGSTGSLHTESYKKYMSELHKNKIVSVENRLNMSRLQKKRFENIEEREKLSVLAKERYKNPEYYNKILNIFRNEDYRKMKSIIIKNKYDNDLVYQENRRKMYNETFSKNMSDAQTKAHLNDPDLGMKKAHFGIDNNKTLYRYLIENLLSKEKYETYSIAIKCKDLKISYSTIKKKFLRTKLNEILYKNVWKIQKIKILNDINT